MTDSAQRLAPCPFCGGPCDPEGWMSSDKRTGPACDECGGATDTVERWNSWPARAALRSSALPETGEPIAWQFRFKRWDGEWSSWSTITDGWDGHRHPDYEYRPLYTRPSPDGAVRVHRATESADAPIGQQKVEDDAPVSVPTWEPLRQAFEAGFAAYWGPQKPDEVDKFLFDMAAAWSEYASTLDSNTPLYYASSSALPDDRLVQPQSLGCGEPDGAVREALETCIDILKAVQRTYNCPDSPICNLAIKIGEAALATAPQQGGEPVVTRPHRGSVEKS